MRATVSGDKKSSLKVDLTEDLNERELALPSALFPITAINSYHKLVA